MKKQTAMFLSFSALLTIGAMSPQVLWHADKNSHRSPASVEQKAPEKIASVEAEVSCLKDKQPKELEAEVKKLMEDKEKIMKELEELKASKEKSEEKLEDKKEKKVAKVDYNEDILGIMSQLTSMMISQQQQSQMMMTQMFSMFQAQQPKQQSYYSPMSDYTSPYAFSVSQFEYSNQNHKSIYSLEGMGHNIGLGYPTNSHGGFPAYFNRTPAGQSDFGPMFERSQFDATGSFQPQTLEARPHNGFDFRAGVEAMSMERISF